METNNNLVTIPECVKYVDDVVTSQAVKFAFLSDAPFLVKVISNNGYCACKDTVYVPQDHFTLASSKNTQDRTVATAKLLPWIMALKDGHLTSVWNTWKFLRNYRLLAKYFIYEYAFLKTSESPYSELILAGFVSTRKTFFGRRLPPETVLQHIKTFLV